MWLKDEIDFTSNSRSVFIHKRDGVVQMTPLGVGLLTVLDVLSLLRAPLFLIIIIGLYLLFWVVSFCVGFFIDLPSFVADQIVSSFLK